MRTSLLSTDLGLTLARSKGVLVPPAGFVFVVDDLDGSYLVDSDGSYIITEA